MKLRFWLAAPIALALGGCELAPRYAPPSIPLPAKFKDEPRAARSFPRAQTWWRSFNDRTLDDLQAQVDAANPDLAAAVAANDAAAAAGGASGGGASPAGRRDRTDHRKQAIGQSAHCARGEPAGLLRQQHSRRAGLLRDRYLGPGARPRQIGEPDRRGERGRARRSPARTARRTCARLCQPARPRRRGEAPLRHDRHLSLGARADEGAARGADRFSGRRRSRPDPIELGGGAGLGTRAPAGGARGCDCGPGRQARGVLFGRRVFDSASAARASARGPGRRVAASARRRRTGTPDGRRQSGRRRRAGEFLPQVHPDRAWAEHRTRDFDCSIREIPSGPSVRRSISRCSTPASGRRSSRSPRRIHRGGGTLSLRPSCAPSRRSRTICPRCAGWQRNTAKPPRRRRRAQGGRPVDDPLSRRRVVVPRRCDRAERRPGSRAPDDRSAYAPARGRHRPDARPRRQDGRSLPRRRRNRPTSRRRPCSWSRMCRKQTHDRRTGAASQLRGLRLLAQAERERGRLLPSRAGAVVHPEQVAHFPQTNSRQWCGEGIAAPSLSLGTRCADCLYWRHPDGGLNPVNRGDMPMAWWARAGICGRHAPRPLSEPGPRAFWRATLDTDCCADGAPRKPHAAS